MRTPKLVVTAVVLAVVPPLASLGCNKKEDVVPAPSATVAPPTAPPPVVTPPPVVQPVTVAPVVAPKALPKIDAGVRPEAGIPSLKFDAGALPPLPTALPTLPNIPASALPGIASGIVGGIIGALPSGVIPVPSR
jgi:hypothetical protein